MEVSRDRLESRMSDMSSGTSMYMEGHQGNCLELVRDLYKELEPQLCKSYRRNVKYIPATPSEDYQQPTLHSSPYDKRRNKVKTARIVIEAVNELQKKRENSIHKSKSPVPKSPVPPSKEKMSPKFNDNKQSSQSLPNLTVN